jgi:hypothetical protein
MKKSSGRANRKPKNLPAKKVAGKKADGVKGGMRKAGGSSSSSGKEFLQFKFDTVFTTK